MTLPSIVGICGDIGAGKDTIASILIHRHGYQRLSWADPLKQVCEQVYLPLGAESRHFWGTQADKAELIPGISGPDGRPTCGRKILETVGTEGFRAACPNTWVHLGMLKVAAGGRWVVPDVRFPNEIEAIHQIGGPLVEVRLIDGPHVAMADSSHASNQAWRAIPRDIVIENHWGQLDQTEDDLLKALMAWGER